MRKHEGERRKKKRNRREAKNRDEREGGAELVEKKGVKGYEKEEKEKGVVL